MAQNGKELKMNDLDKVSGGYLNFPKDEYGNYICPSCGGAINPQSLICGGCGASFGKSTPQEARMYE